VTASWGERDGYNQSAISSQANPNSSKQEGLDFLGFIRPNRDFSKGYGDSKQKKPVLSQAMFKMSHAPSR
jgi:hypothetical protein